MKVAVIGAGSWGTALANLIAVNGHEVALWARRTEVVDAINEDHHNPRYLSSEVLSGRIKATASYQKALDGTDAAVIVTPSQVLRNIAHDLKSMVSDTLPIIVCSKGAEEATGDLPLDVLTQVFGERERFAVLSGPNHAEEVVRLLPSASVIAGSSSATCSFFQRLFAAEWFRTYVSDDPVGVQLCATFKNVIAIAVGISYGIGFGDNTSAALITRGLAEMSRLIVACGGRSITCLGLAGAGDLVVTCMSRYSRNRRFGEYLARGKTLEDFTRETHMVVEGAAACKTLQLLSRRHGIELPLSDVVYGIVWENTTPLEGARQLWSRPLTTEFYGL